MAAEQILLKGDSAKVSIEHDEFGLEKITGSISSLLKSRVAAESYAIGVEGEWGSGKSTLVNFIVEKLSKDELLHRVIRFEPWLVGNKQDLLKAFFPLLITAVREVGADDRLRERLSKNPTLLDSLLSHIAQYAALLGSGIKAVDYAAAFDPSGVTKISALGLKVLAGVAKTFAPKPKSLEQLKVQIKGDLHALAKLVPGLRFTIVIDDLDRLEPSESLEILRLIKAVADFPVVTYLVCFDREILANHVQITLGIESGHSYIEKVFQAFLPLPPQEPFALRRFCRKMLVSEFSEEFETGPTAIRDKQEREHYLFDVWLGRFVQTPRDAIRFCEAIRFGWPYLSGKVDFFDFAWLQLIKLRCPTLHHWVRNYVVSIGSYRDAGRPGDQEPIAEAKKLREIISSVGWETDIDRYGFRDFLPGLHVFYGHKEPQVFDLEAGELERFELNRRLGSPSHWRYYFSFDAPSYALEDDVLANFRQVAASDPAKAAAILRELMERQHDARQGYYFEVFLERLYDIRDRLSKEELIGLVKTFAEVMDEVKLSVDTYFSTVGPWRRANSFLTSQVAPYFPALVEIAPSINWLADVIREQGFAHGLPKGETERPGNQWLDRAQFESCLATLLARFRKLSALEILEKPQPLEILFCWKQLGDSEELQSVLAAALGEDETFLNFIEVMRTWVSSSNRGLYRPLRSETMRHFIDPEAARKRLEFISNSSSIEPNHRKWARDLLIAWESQ